MPAILLYAAASLLYAILAFHFWRTRWRGASAPRLERLERAAILAPFALHTWLVYDMLWVQSELHFGFGQALSVMLWLAVLIYWIESRFLELEGMQAPILALAALPPLLTMERLLFQIILAGFVFLTLTLATGIAFSETLFGRAMKFDHKTVFAVASWLIFAALLAGRYLYGWRGRIALRWTLVGFVALLLAYVGSRFVLFGDDKYVMMAATLVITFLILVFSEVTPKVIGAAYAERIAPLASYVLK